MRAWRAHACLLCLLLAACMPPRAAATESVWPAVSALREAADAVLPAPEIRPPDIHAAAVALIVRYEVSSRGYYEARLKSPIWPGGASGVTWCIGYDGGHQTRRTILADWSRHAAAERLAGTAGIIGQAARALLPTLHDVRTEWHPCLDVFERATLPEYHARAARAFQLGWDALPPPAQGALVSVVYNRGAGMLGDPRREMRALRDVCVPAGDVQCIAREIRAMCRLWRGTNLEAGLCGRRNAEADLALLNP